MLPGVSQNTDGRVPRSLIRADCESIRNQRTDSVTPTSDDRGISAGRHREFLNLHDR